MNVLKESVRHSQFGSGTITDQTMTRITVAFCEEQGTKKFPYPNAFESFLELNDPGAMQKMNAELMEFHKKEEMERQQRVEEEERRLEGSKVKKRKGKD